MATVGVIILHAMAPPSAGPLEGWLAAAREAQASDHRARFEAAGASEVRVIAGLPDDRPFGARLRELVGTVRTGGLVVLGSGSIPLATKLDYRAFVSAAAAEEPRALTNSRYSSDVVAVARAEVLAEVPDLASDNALARWLADVRGYRVEERTSWRLRIDLDSPLDLMLFAPFASMPSTAVYTARAETALAKVRAVALDRGAELLVAGRTSGPSLTWLERHTSCRVRALVEERGLRASDRMAAAAAPTRRRPPRSALGGLLDRDGPEAFGAIVAELADAALVDTRVLLAHRLGADERRWPGPEDRFASDLLLFDRIADPWLRELSRSAAEAPIPIVLGGHTLVGPGVRLALQA